MPFDDEEIDYPEPDPELDALTHAVIGAAIEVHRRLGPGLDEALYEAALAIEFNLRSIPFSQQVQASVLYKERSIGVKRLDFIVGNSIVVELKAIEQLAAVHKAQVNTYLRITGLKVGLLINFNTVVLKDGIRRIIRS